MTLENIEVIFENGSFAVHKLTIDGEILHRTAIPSTVGIILHDPVNDYVALQDKMDLSTLSVSNHLPEYKYEELESSYNVARRVCESHGIEPKSITFVQTLVSDGKSSSKQTTLVYVVIDSRQVPDGTFVESTGRDVIRMLGRQEPIGAPLATAAHYLKLIRMEKA